MIVLQFYLQLMIHYHFFSKFSVILKVDITISNFRKKDIDGEKSKEEGKDY